MANMPSSVQASENIAQATRKDVEPHRGVPDLRASKVVVSLSGFSAAEREVLQDWVARLGAGYSGPLVCRLSTHLVCRDLLAVFGTEKYHKALIWNITMVSFRWVYDSLQAGRLQKYDDYKCDKPSPAYNALREEVRRRQEIATAAVAGLRRPLQALRLSNGENKDAASLNAPAGGVCSKLKRPLQQSNTSPGPAPGPVGQPNCEAIRDAHTTRLAAAHKEVGAGRRSQGGEFTFDVQCSSSSPVRSPWLRTTPTDQPSNTQLHLLPNPNAAPTQDTPETVNLTLAELQDMRTIIIDAKNMPVTEAPDSNGAKKDASAKQPINNADSFRGFCVASRCGAVQSSPVDLVTAFETARASGRSSDDCDTELPSSTVRDQVQKTADTPLGDDPSQRSTSLTDCVDPPSSDVVDEVATDAVASDCPQGKRDVPGGQSPSQGASDIALSLEPADSMERQPLEPPGLVTAGVLYSGFEPGLADIATASKGRRMVRADGRLANTNSASPVGADTSLEDLEDDLEDPTSDDSAEEPFATGGIWDRSRGAKDARPCAREVAAQGKATAPLSAAAPQPLPGSIAGASGAENASVELTTVGSPMDINCEPAALGSAREPLTPATARQVSGQQHNSAARASLQRLLLKIKPDPGMEEAEARPLGPVAGLASRPQCATGPEALQPAAPVSLATAALSNQVKREPGEDLTAGVGVVGPSSGLSGRGAASGAAGERPPQASARRRAAALATSSLVSEPQPMRRPSRSGSSGSIADELGRDGGQRSKGRSLSKDDDSDCSMGGSPLNMQEIAQLDDTPSCSSFEGSMLAGREHGRLSTSNPAQEPTGAPSRLVPGGNPAVAVGSGCEANSKHQNDTTMGFVQDDAAMGDDDDDQGAGSSLAVGPQRPASLAGSRPKPVGAIAPIVAAAPHPTTSTSFISSASAGSEYQVEGQWQPVAIVDNWSISKHLQQAVKLAEEFLQERSSAGGPTMTGVEFIKWLARPPRGNTVRERHPGTVLKKVDFADQITIEPLRLPINCRERTKKAFCPIVALPPSDGGDDGTQGRREMFVVDPRVAYRMPSGEWWLEYQRYYTESDVATMMAATGRNVALPNDFDGRRELLRGTQRAHCRLSHVRGTLAVQRTKKSPAVGRSGGERPVFTRYSFDSNNGEVVTDQPVSDLVVDN